MRCIAVDETKLSARVHVNVWSAEDVFSGGISCLRGFLRQELLNPAFLKKGLEMCGNKPS